MKTAISIPDPVFQAGEASQQLGLSRSELYTRAMHAFIAAHNKQHITTALNQVYNERPSSLDPVVIQLQTASLSREDW